MPNLNFLASTVPEIWEAGSKIQKVDHLTPSVPLLTYFCIFSLGPPVLNVYATFEVSSFNRSRDMEGFPKFQK